MHSSDNRHGLCLLRYDTRAALTMECLAGPEASLSTVRLGAQQYLDVGVPASKLVLGLPWQIAMLSRFAVLSVSLTR